jgi:penicillin-binding protein 1A
VLRPYPSTALGASEVTLLDLTSAYTVYPNLGILHHPWSIREVRDRNGAVLEQGQMDSQEALSAPVAAVMNSIFEDVMSEGTGASARWKGVTAPAGGKTGTMDDYADAIFVGFTSVYTMGVWVGFDVKTTLGIDMTGTAAALPVWIETMKSALEGTDPQPFPVPPGVTWRTVCRDSGVLAAEACPDRYREIFVEGDEPETVCPIHSGDAAVDPWETGVSFEELDRASRDRDRGGLGP